MTVRSRRKWLAATTLLVVAALISLWLLSAGRGAQPEQLFVTQAADEGTVVRVVAANGTLTPVDLISVGTQVSGTIKTILVDYNDRVKEGQLLAEVDPQTLAADLENSRGVLASATANLRLAEANYARNKQLFDQGYIARADLDASTKELDAARAQVTQATATVRKNEANLTFTKIRSPVAGTVVSRQVSVGQTVAASFQTPTLFTIAKDMREMQIEASVAEADVGVVRVGQEVTFTVDAFPDRRFTGNVKQIRNNYTVQQNVVTYTVVVSARNEDQVLRPGMTAYTSIVVDRRENALRVPNAVLRYRPGPSVAMPPVAHHEANELVVYKLEGDQVVAVAMRPGITDGRYTEVKSGPINAGDKLIVSEQGAARKQTFGPRYF